ncbi:MAG: hypothetical protein COU06_00725 [Candidatus Harrisonbacteria bacterium CG10_big_fil_rev_8_21_14_0_10_38_8]|uniref:Uncharacterized protein n=1 Tax=Candidatus Harrisonbacteria bacterium CG10_big_fil_rev_8_21_14_0_10_38_8 TaxID=1974582 RepID=A0A2M6WKH8_9BACT|nr:MAG: hypothetical protein COU06_00725 [Candidatus Harrisonbacteria bacterium CG10_big_fil_rev_8_21_14_0_10_38_8]
MRKLIFLLLLIPIFALAQNVGFVRNNIWLSKPEFFAGEKIRIYTAIFNGTGDDIVGRVGFYNNSQLIDEVSFTATSGGRLQEVWADWTAVKGNQSLSAKILYLERVPINGISEVLKISDADSEVIVKYVDSDTDKDGIGDLEDEVDDFKQVEKDNGLVESSVNTTKKVVKGVDTSVTGFLETANPLLREKKIEIDEEIAQLRQESLEKKNGDIPVDPTSAVKRILKQIYSFILGLAIYVTGNRVLFYLVILTLMAIIFRKLYRRLSNHG